MRLSRSFLLMLSFLLIASVATTTAQEISFKDTIGAYNSHRIHINKTGMKVLGGWGVANAVAGGIGYFAANNDEWKYFHEMNAMWGVINAGIAWAGLAGVRKEMNAKYTYKQAYGKYRSNKKLYLINIGLDVLYVGGGVALNEAGNSAKKNQNMLHGFGKSVAIQGVFLLLFDNVMFASHHRSNSKWYQLMSELSYTGNGIGFIHNF